MHLLVPWTVVVLFLSLPILAINPPPNSVPILAVSSTSSSLLRALRPKAHEWSSLSSPRQLRNTKIQSRIRTIGCEAEPLASFRSARKGSIFTRYESLFFSPLVDNLRRARISKHNQLKVKSTDKSVSLWTSSKERFKANPGSYLMIPVIAGCVGYITNWLAVQMIFYPINWRGIPLKIWEDNPFGILGWQGIVPAKAGKMSERMVEMLTSTLISVPEVFARLNPTKISDCLLPLVQDAAIPNFFALKWLSAPFLKGCLVNCAKDLQVRIESILDLKELVVGEMLRDRTILVELFKKVGSAELRFLTDSGLFFGFLLGIIQMMVWLVFPRGWTLPVGGAVVGYLTNWIALKMIFEPVNPVRVFNLFEVQGLFLKRQSEVAVEFGDHLSSAVLTSQQLWGNMLFGSHSDSFFSLLRSNVPWFIPTQVVTNVFEKLRAVLPTSEHILHTYADKTLALKENIIEKMKQMTSAEFEGVLHPIFQEDEMILIIAGAILGAIAGLVQQRIGEKLAAREAVNQQDPPRQAGTS